MAQDIVKRVIRRDPDGVPVFGYFRVWKAMSGDTKEFLVEERRLGETEGKRPDGEA